MELQRLNGDIVRLELTETELSTLRSGLNEALEALEDWEFSTRMGVGKGEARRVRDELLAAVSKLGGSAGRA